MFWLAHHLVDEGLCLVDRIQDGLRIDAAEFGDPGLGQEQFRIFGQRCGRKQAQPAFEARPLFGIQQVMALLRHQLHGARRVVAGQSVP